MAQLNDCNVRESGEAPIGLRWSTPVSQQTVQIGRKPFCRHPTPAKSPALGGKLQSALLPMWLPQ